MFPHIFVYACGYTTEGMGENEIVVGGFVLGRGIFQPGVVVGRGFFSPKLFFGGGFFRLRLLLGLGFFALFLSLAFFTVPSSLKLQGDVHEYFVLSWFVSGRCGRCSWCNWCGGCSLRLCRREPLDHWRRR